jgi:hypothetical protein
MTDLHESWWASARLALAGRGVSHHLAEPLITDAQQHCADAGQSPGEAYGSPQAFAAAAFAELPGSERAKLDRHGMTSADYLTGAGFYVGSIMILWSVFGGFVYSTWTFDANPARLTGAALLGLTYITAYGLPPALRAAGYPRYANAGYGVAAVMAVLAATAFVALPKTRLFSMPVLAVTALGVLVCWLTTRPGKAPAAEPAAEASPGDPDRWFAQLQGLLVGRHDLPQSRARELAAEARSHIARTGTEPHVEFGPAGEYAEALAQGEPARKDPWWRTRVARMVFTALAIAITIQYAFGWLSSGYAWVAYGIGVPLVLALGWDLVQLIREHRRVKPHRRAQAADS